MVEPAEQRRDRTRVVPEAVRAVRDDPHLGGRARGLADPVLRDQALIGVLRLANSWDQPLAATLAIELSQPEARKAAFEELLESSRRAPPRS